MRYGVPDRLVFVRVPRQTRFFSGISLIDQVGEIVHGQVTGDGRFSANGYLWHTVDILNRRQQLLAFLTQAKLAAICHFGK
jgi:hypothetical protein